MGRYSKKFTNILITTDLREMLKTKKGSKTYTEVIEEMIIERNRKELPPIYSPSKVDPKELAKYRGKWVAIWKDKVIGSGKNEKEAYEEAVEKYPDCIPTLYGVEGDSIE
jgi:predicted CopG family antitoxin